VIRSAKGACIFDISRGRILKVDDDPPVTHAFYLMLGDSEAFHQAQPVENRCHRARNI
jgi:hypothetical protein